MSIPTYEECMLPLMKIAEDGKEHLFKNAIDEISKQFNLTDSERQELLPSGSAFVINSRASWARTYLTKAGLLLKLPVFDIEYKNEELDAPIEDCDISVLNKREQYPESFKQLIYWM